MKILIAGAAGFIGNHLAERFLGEGHSVIGVDNLSTGRLCNLERLLVNPNFRFIQHDLVEPLQDVEALDWVLHFASPASPPKYLEYPIETLRVNAEGTRHLLEVAAERGAQFLLASTSEIYGDPQVHPQPENYWGHVNPIGPRSVYDEAKRYAEALTQAYARAMGVSVRVIRIFNTYGPGMDPSDGRVVTNLIIQALRGEELTIFGSGRQTRSFQYIDDLVEGISRTMMSTYQEPINLGNPDEFSILEFAYLVKEATASPSRIVFKPLPVDDPKQRKPDITLAKRLLNWEPRVNVRDGLAKTVSHLRAFVGEDRGRVTDPSILVEAAKAGAL